MMSHFSLILNEDNCHSLLEPTTPAYSNVTVRRAFIVWLHCGRQNEFRHVCNYFHYLESMEEQLSADQRATSRLHEFYLLSHYPPLSDYLTNSFPKLYQLNNNIKSDVKKIEEPKLEDCVFNLEGYHDIKMQKGVSTNDIIKASQMIKKYCKAHSKTIKKFLVEFLDFAKKTEATNSVNNILMFIKKKYLKDEIETWKNMPTHFSFLDQESFDDTSIKNVSASKIEVVKNNKSTTFNREDHTLNGNKNANKIRILINDSRRKELMNLIPNYSELSINECGTNSFLTKLINIHKKKH